MAQFLLITTLLTIAGLLATGVMGFLASPGHVAQHILFALATAVIGLFSQSMMMFFFIGTGKELKDASKQDASFSRRRNLSRPIRIFSRRERNPKSRTQ